MKKTRDPYPITDVYLLEMNAVDAATVTVGDLCERLSNDFDTGIDSLSVKEVTEHFKNIDASKYNSISYGNGSDGGYSVYVGVDYKNRIKKIIEIKEIKIRPNIDEHDYQVKMRNVQKFLTAGDKVKVTLRFRGREMAHQEIGVNVLTRVREETDEFAKVEAMPKLEGRQMIMVLAPK